MNKNLNNTSLVGSFTFSLPIMPIDSKIIDFIKKHHVLSLATCNNQQPYTANCFYVFNEELQAFIFTSDLHTKHAQQMQENPLVAANIVLETTMIGKIQGLQITGKAKLLVNEELNLAEKSYLKKFPFAILKETTLWAVYPYFLKLTDNRLGFGKKLIWEK